ncbi:MAG: Fic family protein [Bacteroidetes bacterium]|nr:MAG: Fic family protein [Bacteroidota bacterium]
MQRAIYIHQQKKWPKFTWDIAEVMPALLQSKLLQGKLLGKMESLGFNLQAQATLQNVTFDVLKSSEIEGEILPAEQVRSSIAKKLGMHVAATPITDRRVDGVVEMMLDATQNYDKPLTKKRLGEWHMALFPNGNNGLQFITIGNYRKAAGGPMQVVSGAMGKEKVHFEAPDAERLSDEMKQFLKWFNANQSMDTLLKAAIAHLWFLTIHPFDDGNGRMARALTDLLLARADESKQRFYSLSTQIQLHKKQYYQILENTQKGNLHITKWVLWFLSCFNKAITEADVYLNQVMFKAKFWRHFAETSFNSRQVKMLNKLLDGFDGNLTTTKWAKICKCSQDTAYRDIQELMVLRVLVKNSTGGRSTSYELIKKL